MRGDAVVHQTDLLHGVELGDETSERWSLILWIRDSVPTAQSIIPRHRRRL